MAERDDDPFLSRWSRLKRQARRGEAPPEPARPVAPEAVAQPPFAHVAGNPEAAPRDAAETSENSQRMLTEADFADVDFTALDAGSDYARFMGVNVPDAIRQKALARLWTSDPVFAGLDPIHDYHGDYTDAAVAVKEGLATAYRVGRGFLSDEEVAAWERLGQPEVARQVPAEAEPDEVASRKDAAEAVASAPRDGASVADPEPVAESEVARGAGPEPASHDHSDDGKA